MSADSRKEFGDLGIPDLPGFLCIDHIGIAVKAGELQHQASIYRTMGFTEIHREDVWGSDQVREVLLRIGDGPNCVQLLEPLSNNSPVAKQIAKNGDRGGIVHVALRVRDAHAAFQYLKQSGFNIIDEAPRAGSRGTTVFFIHPRTTVDASLGQLIEVVQEGSGREP